MKARLPKEYQSRSQADILKQAQEMQENIQNLQAELDEKEYSVTADGDLVTATVNGKHELLKLDISEDLLKDATEDDDKEMLEDLIITAVNGAIKKATQEADSLMSGATSGLNIPGLF